MIKYIQKLKRKENLTFEESQIIFKEIMEDNLGLETIKEILIGLKEKGETFDEIAGASQVILNKAKSFPTIDYEYGDIVGTGGDKSNLINVSTLSSFVGAACGLKLAKHGNRSVSSKCGSFDLLEQMGISIEKDPKSLKESLDTNGLCFLYAPFFHPSFRFVAPVRRELKTRSIFNILGPLVNPARPTYQLMGVYTPELLKPMAKASMRLGLKKALIVHGSGLDEIAPHGETQVVQIDGDSIKEFILSPKDFGFSNFSLDKVAGGEKEHNYEMALKILSGQGSDEQKKMIAMNTAPLLVMGDKAINYQVGAEMAMDILSSETCLNLVKEISERKF